MFPYSRSTILLKLGETGAKCEFISENAVVNDIFYNRVDSE